MNKILIAAIAALSLSGCAVYTTDGPVTATVVYEPDVVIGAYYVGYYRNGFGYWDGYGWDVFFYSYGHRGYGHCYRGAPREAWEHYHDRGEHHTYEYRREDTLHDVHPHHDNDRGRNDRPSREYHRDAPQPRQEQGRSGQHHHNNGQRPDDRDHQ